MDKVIPIQGLKSRLIAYLGQVREGETLLIVDRGRPLARVVPAEVNPSLQALYALTEQGLLLWDGGKPFGLSGQEAPPIERHLAEVTVAEEPES